MTYVWIDALFNYITALDLLDNPNSPRAKYWPAQFHVIGKEILWFHAVIWPALLMALNLPLPGCVYAHSFWIREGRKMSKSLGNFIDLPTIAAYCHAYSTDAFRWYMLTQGPLDATDADFSHAKFIEVYNADLANGIGNAFSRVSNMIVKYFDGKCPTQTQPEVVFIQGDPGFDLPGFSSSCASIARKNMSTLEIDLAFRAGMEITASVDGVIHRTEPFKLAKDPANMPRVGQILYDCAEALRIAAILLSPAMPTKMGELLRRLGQEPPDEQGRFSRPLAELCSWGGMKPGTPIIKGDALFPRADPDAPAPTPIEDAT